MPAGCYRRRDGSYAGLMETATQGRTTFGDLLRDWRERRRLSQLDLALSADVSARHISFLESGRARPSRAMIGRLAEVLDTPLAHRNELLEAAGFAAVYSRAPLQDEALAPVRSALVRMMRNHLPYPALLFTRHWDIVDANETGRAMFGGSPPGTNAIEQLLTDAALRERIVNLPETLRGMIARLRAESRHVGGDARLDDLAGRLAADPLISGTAEHDDATQRHPFLPVRVRSDAGELVLFTATAELGTAQAISLRDLHLELFFPADDATRMYFQRFSGGREEEA
jgi:transcriptional regulator with XRE-family HTH domain